MVTMYPIEPNIPIKSKLNLKIPKRNIKLTNSIYI